MRVQHLTLQLLTNKPPHMTLIESAVLIVSFIICLLIMSIVFVGYILKLIEDGENHKK